MKLELSIRVSNLKKAGTFKGTSDTFAIVTKLSTKSGEKPEVLGKTEVVKNTLSPEFVKKFIVEYELGSHAKVAVNIFDEDRKGNNIGIGSACFDISELLGARGNTQAKRLKKGGVLFATARKSQGSGSLRLQIRGERLKSNEGILFGKSGPFYELCRKVPTTGGRSWEVVYRSDYVKKTTDPRWEETTLELSTLCAGDFSLPIEFSVYDYDKSGKHGLVGRLETSLDALVESKKSAMERPMLLKKNDKETGTIFVTKAEVIFPGINSLLPVTTGMASASVKSPPQSPIVERSVSLSMEASPRAPTTSSCTSQIAYSYTFNKEHPESPIIVQSTTLTSTRARASPRTPMRYTSSNPPSWSPEVAQATPVNSANYERADVSPVFHRAATLPCPTPQSLQIAPASPVTSTRAFVTPTIHRSSTLTSPSPQSSLIVQSKPVTSASPVGLTTARAFVSPIVQRASVLKSPPPEGFPIAQSTPVSSNNPTELITASAYASPTSRRNCASIGVAPELPLLRQSTAGASSTLAGLAHTDRTSVPLATRMPPTSSCANPQSPVDDQSRPLPSGNPTELYSGTESLSRDSFYPATIPLQPPTTPPSSGSGTASKDMFVDYISGGCELNVAVAIDFTGSNGDPRQPGTLHHMNPYSRNQYEQAIAAIVSILLNYDHDKKIPVMGFGAKYGGVVRHCFQCGKELEVDGLAGILHAYRGVFQTGLVMSRPTIYKDVLEETAKRAEKSLADAQRRGSQSYTILLILTDGAVSDVNGTIACLDRISDSPLSVIIVGVGDEDFGAMRHLDNSVGVASGRNIVQFVDFNQHAHSSESLTKATLEEIPEQLVAYFQGQNIQPLPPVLRGNDSIANLANATDYEEVEEIDLSFNIGEDKIVVMGGGNGFVNGFNAH